MNLIANQNLADKKTSLKWNGESSLLPPTPLRAPLPPHYPVELSPLKIRTFYVTFENARVKMFLQPDVFVFLIIFIYDT